VKIKDFKERVLTPQNILLAGLLFMFLFNVIRSAGLYPTVFGDELSYSRFSRLMPLSESPIPSYLYLLVFRSTSYCGEGFLSCVRLLNSLFFVSAGIFIFCIAKKFGSQREAVYVTLISLAGGYSTYTAYFMPEAMYFLFFWVFIFFALSFKDEALHIYGVKVGLVLAIMALVKVHAVFLLPGVSIFILLVNFIYYRENFLRRGLFTICVVILTFFIIKFGVSYLFAGKKGITILGSLYGSQAKSAMPIESMSFSHYAQIAIGIMKSFKGNFFNVALLYSVPFACLFLFRPTKNYLRKTGQEEFFFLFSISILVLLPLMAVTSVFTASIAGTNPTETVYRLHMRYYNFSFPLLILVALAQANSNMEFKLNISRVLIAIGVASILVFALFHGLAPYIPSFIDGPELRGFSFSDKVFKFLLVFSLISLLLWVARPHLGAKLFVYGFVPLSLAFSTFYLDKEIRVRSMADIYDKAGLFFSQNFPKEDRGSLLISGSEPAGLTRSLFHLDDNRVEAYLFSLEKSLDWNNIIGNKKWLLLVGKIDEPKNVFYKINMDGFSLIRTFNKFELDFRKSSWAGLVSNTKGLSAAEEWGAWSIETNVEIDFVAPLPDEFELYLTVNAYGRNTSLPFTIEIGEFRQNFSIGEEPKTYTFHVKNPYRGSRFSLKVPQPTSPRELGKGDDDRTLGVGMRTMRIVKLR
jgi:phosphoglycerol transferase